MTVSGVLPILVMFFVWGIKPGPHTTTLMVRSVSHGVRAGLAIAAGNNLCHLLYFWLAFWALSLFSNESLFLVILRIVAGLYIIGYSAYEILTYDRTAKLAVKGSYLADIAAGFVVGLTNPLNASFYVGVVPELIGHSFQGPEIVVISFLIFFALLSGQIMYIGFADLIRGLIEDERKRHILYLVSNVLFSMIGAYIIGDAVVGFVR